MTDYSKLTLEECLQLYYIMSHSMAARTMFERNRPETDEYYDDLQKLKKEIKGKQRIKNV